MSVQKTSDTSYVVRNIRTRLFYWLPKNKWVPKLEQATKYPNIKLATTQMEILEKRRHICEVKRTQELYGPNN